MKLLKNAYLILVLILLMVLRLFAEGSWFSAIVFAGFAVALYDIIHKIFHSNRNIIKNRQKERFAIVFIVLNVVFILCLALIVVDLVTNWAWMDNITLLDEITLLTLLISLPQSQIIEWVNNFISGESEVNHVGY